MTICGNKYAEEGDTRMEIVFSGVYYLEIPTGFMTLEIRKATPEETEALRRRKIAKNQPSEDGNVFILTANQETYFIGAWRVDCREVPLNSE